jgi:hypothetical protein
MSTMLMVKVRAIFQPVAAKHGALLSFEFRVLYFDRYGPVPRQFVSVVAGWLELMPVEWQNVAFVSSICHSNSLPNLLAAFPDPFVNRHDYTGTLIYYNCRLRPGI